MNKTGAISIQNTDDDRLDQAWLQYAYQAWLQQPKPAVKELFQIFPEAEGVVAIKIQEEYAVLESELRLLKESIRDSRDEDENTRWFLQEMRRYFTWPTIQQSEKRILSYRRQLAVARGLPKEAGEITEEEIETAKSVPVESLLQVKRSRGKRAYANCPFHEDRTPSFVIYREENTFHCFGCQAHGDAIDFVMRKDSVSFREAVYALIGK